MPGPTLPKPDALPSPLLKKPEDGVVVEFPKPGALVMLNRPGESGDSLI